MRELQIEWHGHKFRVESAHDGDDLVLLVRTVGANPTALPPSVVFSVGPLWNRPGAAIRHRGLIEAGSAGAMIPIYCTCESAQGGA